jgi:Tfp pilus assembly protein FimT
MEMMIVLVILVITAGIAIPAVLVTLRSQQLKRGAEMMRIEWSRAHVKAMKTGRIQVFRYEVGGRQFSIQPWIAADEATETAPGESTAGFGAAPATQDLASEFETKSLPEGVTFAAGEAKVDTRAYEVEEFFVSNAQADGVSWSRPVLFYPDGSASDSYVIVADERQTGYRIQLRGLTGSSYIGEIDTVENLLANAQPGQVTP